MRKIVFHLAFFAMLFALCSPVEAQSPGKVPRIGLLIAASSVITPFTDAFRQGMRELGYVDGKNYILEIRGGGAETDRLYDMAAQFGGRGYRHGR